MATVGKSLKQLIIAFKNVLGSLLRRHPIIFLAFMGLLTFTFLIFTKSEGKMMFGLCLLISFVSILIYSKTDNYAETLLSFMLGVLTIFTITWNSYTSQLFVGFYIGVNVIIFFISSIKLAAQVESELTTAASYMNLANFKVTYEDLNKLSKRNTNYNILAGLDKASAIKFLAYMKVPIKEMEESIQNIELIKITYQVDLKIACEFFKTLFFIKVRSNSYFDITGLLDLILAKGLPLTPEEFLQILSRTKKEIIHNKFSINTYLKIIEDSVMNGEDIEGIILNVKNEMPAGL